MYSFLLINNFFHNLIFGGYERSVYGASPAERLVVLLGLCEFIAERMELIFIQSRRDSIFM